jgi:isopentenyldiphosphate isomerase
MERFDLVDEEGHSLGATKARVAVHRDGDWHQSMHLWVVFDDAAPHVLLQRRSLTKDTNPGLVDVSVAGHLSAGETPRDALREAREEVGLEVDADACTVLGVRRSTQHGNGTIDREIQHIFMVRTSTKFEALRPHPDEVAGLLVAPLHDLYAMITTGKPIVVPERTHHGTHEIVLTREACILAPDGYTARALTSIARRCAGEHETPWRMGW